MKYILRMKNRSLGSYKSDKEHIKNWNAPNEFYGLKTGFLNCGAVIPLKSMNLCHTHTNQMNDLSIDLSDLHIR